MHHTASCGFQLNSTNRGKQTEKNQQKRERIWGGERGGKCGRRGREEEGREEAEGKLLFLGLCVETMFTLRISRVAPSLLPYLALLFLTPPPSFLPLLFFPTVEMMWHVLSNLLFFLFPVSLHFLPVPFPVYANILFINRFFSLSLFPSCFLIFFIYKSIGKSAQEPHFLYLHTEPFSHLLSYTKTLHPDILLPNYFSPPTFFLSCCYYLQSEE